MVIYIDSVFLLNGLLDGLLLYFTGYLSGIERKCARILTAGGIGGAYAVAVFLPFGAPLAWPPIKLLFGLALVFLAYGTSARFWRLYAVFLALSCALAGAVIACGFFMQTDFYYSGAYLLPVRFKLLLAAAVLCFCALYLFSRGSLHHRVEGDLVDVKCDIMGKPVSLRALRDSGNTLCDPVSGAPVLVAEGEALSGLWPETLRAYFTKEKLLQPERTLLELTALENPIPLRLMAYRSVGTASGLLLVCTAQKARIGGYEMERLAVALSPTPVSEQKEYDALWGGPVK